MKSFILFLMALATFSVSKNTFSYTEVRCWGAPASSPRVFSRTGWGWRELPQGGPRHHRLRAEAYYATEAALSYVHESCRNYDGYDCAFTRCRVVRRR